MDRYGVRTIQADWTNKDESIGRLLDDLKLAHVLPHLVIFPAGRPNEPIILSAAYTRKQLIEKLESAGPSGAAKNLAKVP